MKKLTEKRAAELKAAGITHVVSTLKTVYNTEYVKWDSVEGILANGGKQAPAGRSFYGYPVGTNINVLKRRGYNYIHWSEI